MLALNYATIFGAFTNTHTRYAGTKYRSFSFTSGADLGEGQSPCPPPPILNFEVHMFATAANPLHDVGKISLTPLPTQIMDPHMWIYMAGFILEVYTKVS